VLKSDEGSSPRSIFMLNSDEGLCPRMVPHAFALSRRFKTEKLHSRVKMIKDKRVA
jgi:hypothetical protein